MSRLAVLLLSTVLVVTNIQASPLSVPYLDGYIVGGTVVDIQDYPHQVSLLFAGTHFCGGFIINSHFVITAAHCVA